MCNKDDTNFTHDDCHYDKLVEKKMNELFSFFFDSNTKMRIEWFESLNKSTPSGGIVLVGDSITQEFCIHEMLFNNRLPISNRGIGGDTAKGILNRIGCSIIELNPSIVFLLIGTNDMADINYTMKSLVDTIEEIVRKSFEKLPNVTFYILSVLPVNSGIDSATVGKRTNEEIKILNDEINNLAKRNNAHYIDIFTLLKDNDGNLRNELTRDGLHLNPQGYRIFLDAIAPYL